MPVDADERDGRHVPFPAAAAAHTATKAATAAKKSRVTCSAEGLLIRLPCVVMDHNTTLDRGFGHGIPDSTRLVQSNPVSLPRVNEQAAPGTVECID